MRVATPNPARAQENRALSHIASPKQTKPQPRSRVEPVWWNRRISRQPATRRRCGKATGPQSNVVLRRKLGSVASKDAAKIPTTGLKNALTRRHKTQQAN